MGGGGGGGVLAWPNYPPIEADQLQQCITHAEHHGPPPAEMLLIRDANSLCAGHDFRRAVLDAGLTAVLAVTQLITAHLTANGERLTASRRSCIGIRCSDCRCTYWIHHCGAMPTSYRPRLIDRRNAATHSGHAVPDHDVRDAIAVAVEIVAQTIPLPSKAALRRCRPRPKPSAPLEPNRANHGENCSDSVTCQLD